MNVCVAT